jgi:hypothetical protein
MCKNMENAKIGKGKIDAPSWPSVKTKSYLVNKDKIARVKLKILKADNLGRLREPFGTNLVGPGDMNYGRGFVLGFIEKWRYAKDDDGTQLSQAYFFDRLGDPLSVYLLVQRPWSTAFQKEYDEYDIRFHARSPRKETLLIVKDSLEKILNPNSEDCRCPFKEKTD